MTKVEQGIKHALGHTLHRPAFARCGGVRVSMRQGRGEAADVPGSAALGAGCPDPKVGPKKEVGSGGAMSKAMCCVHRSATSLGKLSDQLRRVVRRAIHATSCAGGRIAMKNVANSGGTSWV